MFRANCKYWMQTLSFDMLNQTWNVLRTQNAQEMHTRIPGLRDPRALLMTRVAETPFLLTVMFRGFDQAVSDTDRGIPMAKRFLFDWIKRFGQAQIQRGDEASMIIRITKPSHNPMDEL